MNKQFQQIVIIVITFFALVTCNNSKKESSSDKAKTFNIEARIDTINHKTAYLTIYQKEEFIKLDSVKVKNGKFSFQGRVQFPAMHYILFNEGNDKISVFVENSHISITGNTPQHNDLTITGSSIHTQLTLFKDSLNTYDEKINKLGDKFLKATEEQNKTSLTTIEKAFENQNSLKETFVENYINNNLNSVIAPYLSLKYLYNKEIDELEALSKSFSNDIKESTYAKQLAERINILKKSAVGQVAPAFTLNDRNGNPVSLDSFKGKYLLIDFWSSRCGPCRKENKNLVVAYKKYHHKGFEILGVSFDSDKNKWLKAIEKDKLIWTNVSDLKGWKNTAGKIYGVRSIPHSVLIDKEGVIIAKNLRDKALHSKLKELFDKHI